MVIFAYAIHCRIIDRSSCAIMPAMPVFYMQYIVGALSVLQTLSNERINRHNQATSLWMMAITDDS